uniref:ADP-ribosylation factor-like 5A n=2 Tax=Salmoninae TaxID=504568 RepID=A0A4W5K0U6_9TELE
MDSVIPSVFVLRFYPQRVACYLFHLVWAFPPGFRPLPGVYLDSHPVSHQDVSVLVCGFDSRSPDLHHLFGQSFDKREHKVIIVGLDNAGKTTILYQFSMNEVVHTSPTIGSNVEEIVVNNTHFLMWDIGGQESLRSSWNTYYTNTEFVIIVVDSTDRERISVTKEELYRMLAHEDLKKAGLLIFANKQDVKGCMSVAEISQSLQLTSVKDHQWHIQACCALTGEGLCQGLEWMTSQLRVR